MRHVLGVAFALSVTACASTPPDPLAPPKDATGWRRAAPATLPPLGTPVEPAELPATDVVFTVRTDKPLFAIAPELYGVNSWNPSSTFDPAARPGSVRLGGNRLSAYNWENNASNAGRDYMNQNDGFLASSTVPGAPAALAASAARMVGASAVLTVPIGDHVAADRNAGGDVTKTPDYLATRFFPNKPRREGGPAPEPDLDDGVVYQDGFVAWAKGRYGDAPITFSLDNEPDLWKSSHPAIHPDALTYDGLVERNLTYAAMIKDVWPEAGVLGFVSYGWNGYVSLQGAPDRVGKGEFVDYYLTKLKEAETTGGRRLVDYLDLHWYPEAQGAGTRIVFAASTDPAVAEARMQAPRSLWDPTYQEQSWIAASLHEPIRLIPRMRTKIEGYYPGTKLAFTEWNYGGGNEISGAIATADVLGIFGREGVEMAHIWLLKGSEPFTMAGLKAFRSYDGKGAAFGDVGIDAQTSDAEATSVYASLSSADPGHVVVVAINKRATPVAAGIRLAHPTAFTTATPWVLTGDAAELRAAAPVAAAATNAFVYTMPPLSVSVLELH